MRKTYLGDSVYAAYDGHMLCLTTEDGLGTTNEIFLEPSVLQELMNFIERAYNVKLNVECILPVRQFDPLEAS